MRSFYLPIVGLALAAGCSSKPSLATKPDLGTGDLAMAANDLYQPPDLASPDFSTEPDLAMHDLSMIDTAPPPGIYVDIQNGHDNSGTGTPDNPFATIAKAATVATSGNTIYVAPGVYPFATNGVAIAAGVGIEALTARAATISGGTGNTESYGLTFAGAGFVHGVNLDHALISVSTGTVALDGVRFNVAADSGDANTAAVNVSGTGKVVMTPGGLTSYVVSPSPSAAPGVSSFAYLSGSGQLEIYGGAIVGASGNTDEGTAAIEVSNSASLLLDGVTIDGARTGAIFAQDTAQVTVQNGSLIRACAQTSGGTRTSVNLAGSATFTLDNSTVSASPNLGIYAPAGTTPTVTLQNGAIVEKSVSAGVSLGGGTLHTSGGAIIRNNLIGVQMLSGTPNVTMRATQILNNTNDGIHAVLAPSSVIDLGTGASTGGNTFTGNAAAVATSSNVNLSATLTSASLMVNAVGNTWDPTYNGADGTGHFPSPTSFSAPMATVSGKNLRLAQSGSASYQLTLLATP